MKVPGGVVSTPGAADREGVDMGEDNGTGEIAAFVRARLDEEETDARAAARDSPGAHPGESRAGEPGYGPGEWYRYERYVQAYNADAEPGDNAAALYLAMDGTTAVMDHIARQDPAATLARVEALRAILVNADASERIEREIGASVANGNVDDILTQVAHSGANAWRGARRHIAAIWRRHPDYREEWSVK